MAAVKDMGMHIEGLKPDTAYNVVPLHDGVILHEVGTGPEVDPATLDEARAILTRLAELRTVNNAHRQVRELLKELDSLAERAHRVIATIHYLEVAHAAEAEA